MGILPAPFHRRGSGGPREGGARETGRDVRGLENQVRPGELHFAMPTQRSSLCPQQPGLSGESQSVTNDLGGGGGLTGGRPRELGKQVTGGGEPTATLPGGWGWAGGNPPQAASPPTPLPRGAWKPLQPEARGPPGQTSRNPEQGGDPVPTPEAGPSEGPSGT